MTYLYQKFETGKAQHYKFISQEEALRDACQFIGVFANPYSSSMEREMAMFGAGQNVGAIYDPGVIAVMEELFRKCSNLREGEAVKLTNDDKAFIKAAIEGTVYKPFYE